MEPQEAPSLGIQDIQNALRIIDFAAEQGAFKGWSTINQVLAVRTRLEEFVTYAAQQSEANAAPAETDTPAADTAPAEPVVVHVPDESGVPQVPVV